MTFSCSRLARCVIWASMIVALPVQAVICKTVDENGVVGYTDTPRSECTNPVQLPGYSRYAPRPIADPGSAPSPLPSDQQAGGEAEFNGYTAMQIVAPKNYGTVQDNEGRVSVQIALEPGLQEGHTIKLILDGKQAAPPAATTTIALTGIDRGTHSLSAQVLDKDGAILRSVGPVRFTLRRAAVEPTAPPSGGNTGAYSPKYTPDSNQQDSFTPTTPPGAYDSGTVPGNSYDPGAAGNYSPTPSSIPKSNGTNPAFKPNYKP